MGGSVTGPVSGGRVTLHHGDCLEVLRQIPDASIDAVVTDPPYGLEFMGKEWDGADGFRRSLNPADVGRDNASGRTSRTSPEYRTASKAQAARRQEGGIRQATAPSFLGGLNPKCLACNRWQRGSNPCRCDAPEWTQERLVRLHSFQEWCEVWATECLRVLKPGGHLLAFGGTRTWHRLACAVEDAGFEVRDSIAWLYGSGFPKSMNVAKAITGTQLGHGGNSGAIRRATMGDEYEPTGVRGNRDGVTRRSDTGMADRDLTLTPDAEQWQGWGTALKPAFEPVVVARKPLAGTVAANVLAHSTGALNIDGCRIGDGGQLRWETPRGMGGQGIYNEAADLGPSAATASSVGRWPANVVLDESQAAVLDAQSGEQRDGVAVQRNRGPEKPNEVYGGGWGNLPDDQTYGGSGGASRFFYVAKADSAERPRINGTAHPTVKPLDLMRWLVRLVTPPGGTVLEPFAGSGTTVEACILEGFRCIAIEREAEYLPLIEARIARRLDPVRAVELTRTEDDEPDLFGGVA
jgi:site-specific DNA-methyltransferase (adenine-specific)